MSKAIFFVVFEYTLLCTKIASGNLYTNELFSVLLYHMNTLG